MLCRLFQAWKDYSTIHVPTCIPEGKVSFNTSDQSVQVKSIQHYNTCTLTTISTKHKTIHTQTSLPFYKSSFTCLFSHTHTHTHTYMHTQTQTHKLKTNNLTDEQGAKPGKFHTDVVSFVDQHWRLALGVWVSTTISAALLDRLHSEIATQIFRRNIPTDTVAYNASSAPLQRLKVVRSTT